MRPGHRDSRRKCASHPAAIKSDFALRVEPAAPSKSQSLSTPARSPRAAQSPSRRQSAQNGGSDRDDAVQRVLEMVATEEAEEAAAIPKRRAPAPVQPPPPTRRKKDKKKDKRTEDAATQEEEIPADETPARRKRRTSSVFSNFHAWLPLACTVASFGVYVAVAASTVPAGLEPKTYVWHKLGFILTVILIGTPALLAASFFIGSFGDVLTVVIKIPAIILTQAWAEDLLALQPLPYVPTFGAWAATYFLIVNTFELEGLEAQGSMCIVRGVHTAVYYLVFAGMLTPPQTTAANPGNWLWQPQGAAVQNPAPPERKDDARPDGAKKDEAPKVDGAKAGAETENEKANKPDREPIATQLTDEERSLTLTRKFGEALVAQDYKRAYEMMSRTYQRKVTLDEFSAIHRQALFDYGKPLKAEAGHGETESGTLTGPEFERFGDVPPNDRFAWTYANLTAESDSAEKPPCCDCWLLLVKRGRELRVGAFEYEACN